MPCALLFDEDIPDDFLCPITYALMQEPVVAEDGYTYERAGIEGWCRTRQAADQPVTSPISRAAIDPRRLVDNRALRNLIALYCEQSGLAVPASPAQRQQPPVNGTLAPPTRLTTSTTATPVPLPAQRQQQQTLNATTAPPPPPARNAAPIFLPQTSFEINRLLTEVFRDQPSVSKPQLLDAFERRFFVDVSWAGQLIHEATTHGQIVWDGERFSRPQPLTNEGILRLLAEVFRDHPRVSAPHLELAFMQRFAIIRPFAVQLIRQATVDGQIVMDGDCFRAYAPTTTRTTTTTAITGTPPQPPQPQQQTVVAAAPSTVVPSVSVREIITNKRIANVFLHLQRTSLNKAQLLDAIERCFLLQRPDADTVIQAAVESEQLSQIGGWYTHIGPTATTTAASSPPPPRHTTTVSRPPVVTTTTTTTSSSTSTSDVREEEVRRQRLVLFAEIFRAQPVRYFKTGLSDAIKQRFAVGRAAAGAILEKAVEDGQLSIIRNNGHGYVFTGRASSPPQQPCALLPTNPPRGYNATNLPPPTEVNAFLNAFYAQGTVAVDKALLLEKVERIFSVSQVEARIIIKKAVEEGQLIADASNRFTLIASAGRTATTTATAGQPPRMPSSSPQPTVPPAPVIRATSVPIFETVANVPQIPAARLTYFFEERFRHGSVRVGHSELLGALERHFGIPRIQAGALVKKCVDDGRLTTEGKEVRFIA